MDIALIVDCYLRDNKFSKTRAIFKKEAASLISNGHAVKVHKNLTSLRTILKEYVSLKRIQSRLHRHLLIVSQKKHRLLALLHGMQAIINSYNATATPIYPGYGEIFASPIESEFLTPRKIYHNEHASQKANPGGTPKRSASDSFLDQILLAWHKRPRRDDLDGGDVHPSATLESSLYHLNLSLLEQGDLRFNEAQSLFGLEATQSPQPTGSPSIDTPPQQAHATTRYHEYSIPMVISDDLLGVESPLSNKNPRLLDLDGHKSKVSHRLLQHALQSPRPAGSPTLDRPYWATT